MGYASYTVRRRGEQIEAGYAVETTCEEPGCRTEIDRGLGYLCGETPGGDEYGCGGYFCGDHLYVGAMQQCDACWTANPVGYDVEDERADRRTP